MTVRSIELFRVTQKSNLRKREDHPNLGQRIEMQRPTNDTGHPAFRPFWIFMISPVELLEMLVLSRRL